MGPLVFAVLVHLDDMHDAIIHFGGFGIHDPLDVTLAKGGFEQPLGVADAAEAEMTDIGFRSDESHRHLVAQLPPAELGIENHGELIGRAEAGSSLYGANDDGTRIGAELLPGFARRHGMSGLADRVRMAAMRPQAGHFVEGKIGSGSDYQVVVTERPAVIELQLIAFCMETLGADRDIVNALPRKLRGDRHLNIGALAPLDRHPWIGRRELEGVALADDSQPCPGDAVAPSSHRPSACRRVLHRG